MSIVNKREFKVTDENGKELILAAIRPNYVVREKADIEERKMWGKLVKEGVLLETNLWSELRKQKLWDEDKQNQLSEIDKRLEENENMLPDDKGKVKQKGVTLKKARDAAIQLRRDRLERVLLLSDFTKLKNNTCEGLATNAKFNFLVSQCIVHADTNKPFFSSLEDYMNKGDDPIARKAAEEFAILYYNHDPDFDKNLPENQFLLKHKMCRDGDLSLVDKEGNLIDVEGNKVDELGMRLDQKQPENPELFDIVDDWNLDSQEEKSPE